MTFRTLILALIALAITAVIGFKTSYGHSDDYVRDRTVRLESAEGSCTGTLMYSPVNNKAYVLTAAHCEALAFNGSILAEKESGEEAFLPILKIDRQDDLMLLANPWDKGLYFNPEVRFHQSVRAIGWGMGERPFVSRGEILRVSMLFQAGHVFNDPQEDAYGSLTRHLLTTVLLRPGNSGGPLVDDDNNLVAIDVVSYGGSEFSGEVAPDVIVDFFKDVK
jgi:S1-C subfamily serine protease